MYLPDHFRSDDLAVLDALVARDSFATIVTVVDGEPFVSHLPVTLERDGAHVRLAGHFARANPHWRDADGARATIIVHGPHAHVSPSWYERPQASVPTWNYVVAHVRGRLRLTHDLVELERLVSDLANHYEETWRFDEVTPETQQQLRGIVGFELVADRVDIKRKLSQHHSVGNLRGAAAGLAARNRGDDAEIAALMDEIAARKSPATA